MSFLRRPPKASTEAVSQWATWTGVYLVGVLKIGIFFWGWLEERDEEVIVAPGRRESFTHLSHGHQPSEKPRGAQKRCTEYAVPPDGH